jgi:peptidoglycan/LPS O-acetylase OafA/YrhL
MKSKSYMPALTGIRAIAAYLVFFHHYNSNDFPATVRRMLWEFHIGVNIFFVLSGFLIYYRYFNNVQFGKRWLSQYFVNRIARIYPVYAILTIASFYFYPKLTSNTSWFYGTAQGHFKLLLLNLSFLKGFFNELDFTGIAQSWTLTVEECFYAIAPLLFLLIKRNNKAFIYLPLLITGIGIGIVSLVGRYSAHTHGFFGDYIFMFLYTFNGTCIEFIIGMYLAKIILKSDDSISKVPLYTSLGALIMIISLIILSSFKQTEVIICGLFHPLGTVTDHVLLPIGTALFFYGLIKEQTWVQRFLASPTMVLLGKSSYAFYLVHLGFIALFLQNCIQPLTDGFCSWLLDHHFNLFADMPLFNPLVTILLKFVALNIVSIFIFKLIEEPMNHLIRKAWAKFFI